MPSIEIQNAKPGHTILASPLADAGATAGSGNPSVRYVGFAQAGEPERVEVLSGAAVRVLVTAGDQLVVSNDEGASPLWLVGGDASGQALIDRRELPGARTVPLDMDRFDASLLRASLGRSHNDGTEMVATEFDDTATPAGTARTLRACAVGTLWLIVPAAPADQARGGGASLLVTRGEPSVGPAALPLPLGLMRDEIRVPRCTARAYRVKAGEYVQIIDVEGRQCSDFMAVREDRLAQGVERFIDTSVTRTMVGGAYPGPGLFDKYFDQDMQPLLMVVQDTVGRHDTFALACTARGYEERGFPGHDNCSDNISGAYAPFGIEPRAAWPAINLFFNSWILPTDNRLRSEEAWSMPGDYVVMRALTDLICVSTACPDDIDPINGWNPTDIHVRIYPADAALPAARSYRSHPEAKPTLTQPSAFHPRTSSLTKSFGVARDLWLPTNYDATRTLEEYRACREAVTVQDLSSLRKFDVMGPDAEELLELCTTRDVRRLSVNRSAYTLVCDVAGSVIDDGILFRMAADLFRWLPSSEASAQHMRVVAAERGLSVWIRSHQQSLPNLAIQGPNSRALLEELVFTQPTQPSLASLKWFGFTIARLRDRDGPAFMLTRTGYTGELGFEILCNRADALVIWDALMEVGERHGLTPMGSEALDILRVESGLAARGAEFGVDTDAFEAGLQFALDFKKPDFIGKRALERIGAAPRRLMTGLVLAGNEVPAHGDGVYLGQQRVGTVTSAVRSPALGRAVAMARVAVEWSEAGHALEVGRLDGQMKRLPCTTAPFPFVDPQRARVRA